MSTQAIATSLEEWAAENSAVNAYPNEPDNFAQAFPIVACRITRDEEMETSADFTKQSYQQIRLQVLTVELAILVSPDPAWTSDQELYSIVDDLKAALVKDSSLGQRVEQASRIYRASYEGEAQTPDGTRANMATFRITISTRVES